MELAVAMLLILLNLASWCVLSEGRLLVDMTLVSDASSIGACKLTVFLLIVLLIYYHEWFFIYGGIINQ